MLSSPHFAICITDMNMSFEISMSSEKRNKFREVYCQTCKGHTKNPFIETSWARYPLCIRD